VRRAPAQSYHRSGPNRPNAPLGRPGRGASPQRLINEGIAEIADVTEADVEEWLTRYGGYEVSFTGYPD
jgi:hypothetical protein